MSTKQIILTLKYTGLLLFTIIRIVWFSPWEKKLMTEKIWDLKKFLKKKIMSWCCASVIKCALYWQFNFMLELFSPLNIDLNSYTNVFVFKGKKTPWIHHMYKTHRNVFRYHSMAYCIYPTHRVILQVHQLLLINFYL